MWVLEGNYFGVGSPPLLFATLWYMLRGLSWIPLGKHFCGLPFSFLPVFSLETDHVCWRWWKWPAVCWVGVAYLQMAGEEQRTSTDLHSQTALGYYYLYGFDWKLPRHWTTNLTVAIWKKPMTCVQSHSRAGLSSSSSAPLAGLQCLIKFFSGFC